jgi:hypothetical protein
MHRRVVGGDEIEVHGSRSSLSTGAVIT